MRQCTDLRLTLRAAPRVPTWRRVLSQFQDPLIYLLLGAVAIALVAWVIEGRVGWPVDAIVIAIVVLLNGGLGFVQWFSELRKPESRAFVRRDDATQVPLK